jgi:hypothetical protein
MAEIIKKHLLNFLFFPGQDAEDLHAYPSPKNLIDKIIIKGKGKFIDVKNKNFS